MSRRYVIGRLVFCTQTPDYVYLCLKRASVRKTRTLGLCLCLGEILGAQAISHRVVRSDCCSYMSRSLHFGDFNPTSGEALPFPWSGWSNPHRHLPPCPIFTTLLRLFKKKRKKKTKDRIFSKWCDMITPDPFPLCPFHPSPGSSRVDQFSPSVRPRTVMIPEL